jgi:hypothetical protein
MNKRVLRALLGVLLAVTAGGAGYAAGNEPSLSETVTAPGPNSVRVLYSLDKKQNDKEIVALIDSAEVFVYFAMYEFTLPSIADALARAKERGVEVRGLIDSGEAENAKAVLDILSQAEIPVLTERHLGGSGIMHIKAIVTDKAYAVGSYNWTKTATTVNDELLEIGTSEELRQTYEHILKKLFSAYSGTSAQTESTSATIGVISYTEAPRHIGSYASVTGTLVKSYTAKSGTVFLDFCADYKSCPFTAVIFASDAKEFGDLGRYEGKSVVVTGKITLYEGKAEIVLNSPRQISESR